MIYNHMMANPIIDKEEILKELKKIGITQDNLVSVYLFGSCYWGYADEKSDIDLYVIIKKDVGIKQLDLDKISFRYISTLEETKEAILKGSWARYYVLKYTSKLLIGDRVELPEYPKEKVKEYLEAKKKDTGIIPQSPLKWGYLTLMAHIFLLNHLFYKTTDFSLDSYKECKFLNKEDQEFISKLKEALFNHKDVSVTQKERIVKTIEKINTYIVENIDET